MDVLLDVLFKNLVLHILRREMSVLVFINNVCNVNSCKKIFVITLYRGLSALGGKELGASQILMLKTTQHTYKYSQHRD